MHRKIESYWANGKPPKQPLKQKGTRIDARVIATNYFLNKVGYFRIGKYRYRFFQDKIYSCVNGKERAIGVIEERGNGQWYLILHNATPFLMSNVQATIRKDTPEVKSVTKRNG